MTNQTSSSTCPRPARGWSPAQLHRVQRGHGKRFVQEPPPGPVHRPARVAVMLALAHKIQDAIDRGTVRDRAEVARRLGFTRARITHLLDLHLAGARPPGADPRPRGGRRRRAHERAGAAGGGARRELGGAAGAVPALMSAARRTNRCEAVSRTGVRWRRLATTANRLPRWSLVPCRTRFSHCPRSPQLLKVAEKTVYTMAQKGELPAFKVRGQWRFKRDDIDAWIERQKAAAARDDEGRDGQD